MRSRILYLCGGRSFFSRSPGRKLEEVAACWQRAGHEVKQLCGGDVLEGEEPPAEYGSQQTYSSWYRRLAPLHPLVASASEWRDIRHDSRLLAHLHGMASAWRPDLVWERSSRLHCAGLVFARRIGAPYVLEWKDHLVHYRHSLFRGRALRMEARKNREADWIVVESAVLRDALTRDGLEAVKIIVAHNAVRADEFAPDEHSRVRVRKELGLDDDTVLVGYLGSYAWYHDTARLVLAASVIRSTHPALKTTFLMVGAGKETAATRKLAAELGLLGDVLTMKPGVPQHEVPAIQSALDIAVLPGSTDIICPIKVQEYMAAGLPVVVPDYACNREVVCDGESGVLFTPHDEQALARAIASLAADAGLRARLGHRARAEVARRFTWEATWGAALERVLQEMPSHGASAG